MSEQIAHYNTAYLIIRQAEQDIHDKTGMQIRLQLQPHLPNPAFKSPQHLLEIVATELHMRMTDYKKRSRLKDYTELRFIGAMLLLDYFPHLNKVAIGRMFDQDHSTVIAGLERGRALLFGGDETFTKKYTAVIERIASFEKEFGK
jgi:chromosomal replication initiation ATPase DnaA